MGTVHAFEVAAEHGARVVVATSPERWGQGVRCAESLAIDFARTRAVDVRIVRVASAYGPRMSLDDTHVVQRRALQALRGADLEQPGPLGLREGITRTVRWLDERLGAGREAPRTSGITVRRRSDETSADEARPEAGSAIVGAAVGSRKGAPALEE